MGQLNSTIQGLETINKGFQEISDEKNTLQSTVEKLKNDLNKVTNLNKKSKTKLRLVTRDLDIAKLDNAKYKETTDILHQFLIHMEGKKMIAKDSEKTVHDLIWKLEQALRSSEVHHSESYRQRRKSIRSEHTSSSDDDEEYNGDKDQHVRRKSQASHVMVSAIERLKSTVRSNNKMADVEAKYEEYEAKIKAQNEKYEEKIMQLNARSNNKIADVEAKYEEYEAKIKAQNEEYEAKITQLNSTIQGLETINKGFQEISDEKNTLQSTVEKLKNDLNKVTNLNKKSKTKLRLVTRDLDIAKLDNAKYKETTDILHQFLIHMEGKKMIAKDSEKTVHDLIWKLEQALRSSEVHHSESYR